jgi:hypothetical protein
MVVILVDDKVALTDRLDADPMQRQTKRSLEKASSEDILTGCLG